MVIILSGIQTLHEARGDSLVLNSAANLMAESTKSDLQPPSNQQAVAYMRARIDQLRNPPEASAKDGLYEDGYDLDQDYA